MEIKDLGKFGLIERLTKNIVPQNASTQQGIGDDAAVLNYSNKEVLVTSKMFMEGVQFDLTYIDMEHFGLQGSYGNDEQYICNEWSATSAHRFIRLRKTIQG